MLIIEVCPPIVRYSLSSETEKVDSFPRVIPGSSPCPCSQAYDTADPLTAAPGPCHGGFIA